MKSISILGCGWLGLPLAVFLIEKGFRVKGSTTDRNKLEELENNGIEPFLLELNPELSCGCFEGFFNSDILIINFPPERREDIEEYHRLQFLSLKKAILNSGIKKVIFTSSTSVYPEINGEVTEAMDMVPNKNSGRALKEVENLLLNSNEFRTTVLRLAGLIGYDRNPRNFLEKRKVIHKINSPVNLVHRDDCVNVIYEIIDKDIWDEVFNVCCDVHPLRKDFYESEAEIAGVDMPEFKDTGGDNYKIVSNKKLREFLSYNFKYPNPLFIE